jgi:pseudaminic acid cytidylyltransferase
MIAHAIKVARASGLFKHVVVSTEDAEIAQIARDWGADTPFFRPNELADDYTTTVPVVAHAIRALEDLYNKKFNYVCCIYPCAPFIKIEDLIDSLLLLDQSDVDYCFPVAEFPAAIQRALRSKELGLIKPFYPEYELVRTQDLEKAFYDTGQFYWGSVKAWLTNSRVQSSAVGYPIPNWRVVDIDTEDDWERAELLRLAYALKI